MHVDAFVVSAEIAQLGERQTEDLKVPGSIPGLGSLANGWSSPQYYSPSQAAEGFAPAGSAARVTGRGAEACGQNSVEAACGIRTHDLALTKRMLYQLS